MISNILKKDSRITAKLPELLTLPKVVKVHKFTEESVASFCNDVSEALTIGQNILPIVIDSYGGQVYSLLAMIDILKSIPIPVATIAVGKAMSCGAILFSCGSDGKRYMSPNSTLMIHDVSGGQSGKVLELKEDAKEAERLNDLIYKLMARNVGKSDDYFMKIVHEKGHADWFLTPQECVDHGLANHIRIPMFKTEVKVESTLE